MLSPNLAFNLFSKQPFSVNGQVFNFFLFILWFICVYSYRHDENNAIFVYTTRFYPDKPTPTFSEITRPDLTCIFPTRHNTSETIDSTRFMYWRGARISSNHVEHMQTEQTGRIKRIQRQNTGAPELINVSNTSSKQAVNKFWKAFGNFGKFKGNWDMAKMSL